VHDDLRRPARAHGGRGVSALPERELDVSAELMVVMADLLDDPNEIHLDPEAARRMGLGDRVVNQGPTNCGYVVAMLRDAFPGATLTRLTLRLGGPVRGGDHVVAGGEVTADDGEVVACDVWLDVQGAHRAIEGTAQLRRASPAGAAPR
jgi:3-hydroxybutyryl-CoA dehydratase